MTRWVLVPVQEPSALIARIRKRLDVVVGAVASIADPEERWEALQALQRDDAAVEAVLASTPRSARSHSARADRDQVESPDRVKLLAMTRG